MPKKEWIEGIEFDSGVIIVKIAGDITFATLEDVQKEFRHKVKGLKINNILFNLKDILEMDSSGIAGLVDLLKYMKSHQTGDKIGLINVSPQVDSLQAILKTNPLFTEFKSREEAIASLR